MKTWTVWDVNHEYDPLSLKAVPIRTFSALQEALMKGENRIVFRPSHARIESFEYFCACHWELSSERLIVVDEINRFMKSSKMGEHSSRLIDLGRHRGLGVMGACRRILGVDKLLCSQVEVWVLGKTILPNDVKYLSEFLPGQAMEKIGTIERYNFVLYDDLSDDVSVINSYGLTVF